MKVLTPVRVIVFCYLIGLLFLVFFSSTQEGQLLKFLETLVMSVLHFVLYMIQWTIENFTSTFVLFQNVC